VWGIISAILNIGWLSTWPIWWSSWLIGSIFQASLGLILGIGTLKTFIKNPQAQAKTKAVAGAHVPPSPCACG
jgi:hypothetical protein